MRRLLVFVALIGLASFGACGGNDSPAVDNGSGDAGATTTAKAAVSEIHKVSMEAKEYSYAMPKSVEAGTVEFTMKNVGKELHLAGLAKVAAGKTFADATKDLAATTPPAQPSSSEVGGIASTSPGLAGDVTLALEPGTYFFACFVPGPDGAPHFTKGMIQPFEVTASKAAPAAVPTAAGKVTAKEFSYTTDYKAKAGEQVIELTNGGTVTHEITLLEFLPGKGPADLQAFFAKPEGAPPATFYGGPVIAKGATASWTTPALVAGKSYFFMCLIPDTDGVPHAAKGMVLPVSVT